MKCKPILFLAVFALLLTCSKEAIEEDLTSINEDNGQAAISLVESSNDIQGKIIEPQAELRGRAVTRDIRIRGNGTIRVEEDSPDCFKGFFNRVFIEGEGLATHLGRFTNYLCYCQDDNGNAVTYPGGYLIAANGDSLFTRAIAGDIDPELGPYQVYIFENGSGRFETATGNVTLYIIFYAFINSVMARFIVTGNNNDF